MESRMEGAIQLPARRDIFEHFTDEEKTVLLTYAEETTYASNTHLIKKDDCSDDLYIIKSGSVIVKIYSEPGTEVFKEYTLSADDQLIGELSFVGRSPRSADVTAIAHTTLLKLTKAKFEALKLEHPDIALKFLSNISDIIADRVRASNATIIKKIAKRLKHDRGRVLLGEIFTFIIVLVNVYILTTALFKSTIESASSTSYISITILFLVCIASLIVVTRKKVPLYVLGLNREGIGASLREAFLLTLPILVGLTFAKWALVTFVPSNVGLPIFDPTSSYNIAAEEDFSLTLRSMIFGIYMFGVLIQEFVARGCLQGLLQKFLAKEHRYLYSNIIATSIFSVLHIKYSIFVAIIVIPFSLFWGYLFSKHKNLAGCCLSHMMIGAWALFVLDFERLLV